MTNQQHEQDLIDGFVQEIRRIVEKQDRNNLILDNDRCKRKIFADIEFTLPSGQRWAIEAKSNKSKNNYNTVHGLFGDLLKETGRENRENCEFAILIPKDGIDFYYSHFREINRCKFFGFGWLIPVRTIFSYDCASRSIKYTSWENFYDKKFEKCKSGFPGIGQSRRA